MHTYTNMKLIAVLDNFIETPALKNFNELVENYSKLRFTYHSPSLFGKETLSQLKKVDGIIIFGSKSHVFEKLSWHQDVLDFVIPKLESGTPTLGICFGHQLIASYYGCEVDYINQEEENFTEIRKLHLFEKNIELELSYAHVQCIKKLSNNFIHLGASSISHFDYIKHKTYPFTGIQAHPETSLEYLKSLTEDERLAMRTKENGNKLIQEFFKNYHFIDRPSLRD